MAAVSIPGGAVPPGSATENVNIFRLGKDANIRMKFHLPSTFPPAEYRELQLAIRKHGGEVESRMGKADIMLADVSNPVEAKKLQREAKKLGQPLPMILPKFVFDCVQAGMMLDWTQDVYSPDDQLDAGLAASTPSMAIKANGRNPFTDDDRAHIVQYFGDKPEPWNVNRAARDLALDYPTHTKFSWLSYLQSNMEAKWNIRQHVLRWRVDNDRGPAQVAQASQGGVANSARRTASAASSAPASTTTSKGERASAEAKSRSAKHVPDSSDAIDEEVEPADGWDGLKGKQLASESRRHADDLSHTAAPSAPADSHPAARNAEDGDDATRRRQRDGPYSSSAEVEDELEIRPPRPAKARAEVTATRADPSLQQDLGGVAADVSTSFEEAPVDEESEPEGGWTVSDALATELLTPNPDKSKTKAGTRPSRTARGASSDDSNAGEGEEFESNSEAESEVDELAEDVEPPAHISRDPLTKAALSEPRREDADDRDFQPHWRVTASDNPGPKRFKFTEDDKALLVRRLSTLYTSSSEADPLEKPPVDFWDALHTENSRHSAMSWQSHFLKNAEIYREAAKVAQLADQDTQMFVEDERVGDADARQADGSANGDDDGGDDDGGDDDGGDADGGDDAAEQPNADEQGTSQVASANEPTQNRPSSPPHSQTQAQMTSTEAQSQAEAAEAAVPALEAAGSSAQAATAVTTDVGQPSEPSMPVPAHQEHESEVPGPKPDQQTNVPTQEEGTDLSHDDEQEDMRAEDEFDGSDSGSIDLEAWENLERDIAAKFTSTAEPCDEDAAPSNSANTSDKKDQDAEHATAAVDRQRKPKSAAPAPRSPEFEASYSGAGTRVEVVVPLSVQRSRPPAWGTPSSSAPRGMRDTDRVREASRPPATPSVDQRREHHEAKEAAKAGKPEARESNEDALASPTLAVVAASPAKSQAAAAAAEQSEFDRMDDAIAEAFDLGDAEIPVLQAPLPQQMTEASAHRPLMTASGGQDTTAMRRTSAMNDHSADMASDGSSDVVFQSFQQASDPMASPRDALVQQGTSRESLAARGRRSAASSTRRSLGGFEAGVVHSNDKAGIPLLDRHRDTTFHDFTMDSDEEQLVRRAARGTGVRTSTSARSSALPPAAVSDYHSRSMLEPRRPREASANLSDARRRRVEEWASRTSAELEAELEVQASKVPASAPPKTRLARETIVEPRSDPRHAVAAARSSGLNNPAQRRARDSVPSAIAKGQRSEVEALEAKRRYTESVKQLCNDFGLSSPAQAVPFMMPNGWNVAKARKALAERVASLATKYDVSAQDVIEFVRTAEGRWEEAEKYIRVLAKSPSKARRRDAQYEDQDIVHQEDSIVELGDASTSFERPGSASRRKRPISDVDLDESQDTQRRRQRRHTILVDASDEHRPGDEPRRHGRPRHTIAAQASPRSTQRVGKAQLLDEEYGRRRPSAARSVTARSNSATSRLAEEMPTPRRRSRFVNTAAVSPGLGRPVLARAPGDRRRTARYDDEDEDLSDYAISGGAAEDRDDVSESVDDDGDDDDDEPLYPPLPPARRSYSSRSMQEAEIRRAERHARAMRQAALAAEMEAEATREALRRSRKSRARERLFDEADDDMERGYY